MNQVLIGYQGDVGSNAEEAAGIFAEKMFQDAGTNVFFVPLVTSSNVLQALQDKTITYGVVAVENSLGGTVQETWEMMQTAAHLGFRISAVAEHVLPIHHCLFAKSASRPVRCIASHEQALKQTARNRERLYPDAEEMQTVDTAYAAKMLQTGELPDDCAVLCRRNAGEDHCLVMICENMEDEPSYTTFNLLMHR